MIDVNAMFDKLFADGFTAKEAVAKIAHDLQMSADDVIMQAVGYTPEPETE